MIEEKTEMGAWVAAAMSPMLVTAASGTAWPMVLLVGTAGCLLSALVRRFFKKAGRAFWGLQWLWIVVLLSWVLGYTRECWQLENGGSRVIPVTLLALSACSAAAGRVHASRIGGILFPLLVLIYGVLLSTAVPEVRCSRLLEKNLRVSCGLLLAFLLPAGAALLPGTGKGGWLGILFAAAIAAVTAGTLPEEVLETHPLGFYEVIRGTSIFGIGERFEAILSGAMTLGWFALLSLLLDIAGFAAGQVRNVWERGGVWLCAAAAGILYIMDIGGINGIMDALGAVFWGVLPLLWGGIGLFKNKSKKGEKRY